LITPEAILACYREAQNTQAATLARPVTETIKKADQDQRVETSVSREDLWFMETPQIFSTSLIKKAYEAVEASSTLVTDEVSALQLIGQPTSLVNSPCFNPKITYPSDLSLANSILLQK
ncbi:MAG: 2-C-methyl-D-erythritol 4-phosphate cytidylyltransferase, partial [Verrucomicrobiota bacterium]